jgi:quercetin dioxygenase-like cupin family protein
MRRVCFFVAALFSMTFAGENVVSQILAKSASSWDGSVLPSYPKSAPEISIVKITIPPHTKLPMHQHPVINAGYMIAGALTVVTEEPKTLHLKAGDALIEVVNRWHYGINEGDEPAQIVVFYAGEQTQPYSIMR